MPVLNAFDFIFGDKGFFFLLLHFTLIFAIVELGLVLA